MGNVILTLFSYGNAFLLFEMVDCFSLHALMCRDSLGALANAIREYEGGVIMISHNREFTEALCTETWICERGRLRREGESFTEDIRIEDPNKFGMSTEPEKVVKDSYGNVIKVDRKKKLAGKVRLPL